MAKAQVKAQSIMRADGSDINIIVNTVESAKAQVIFAHGAGANMSHEFMSEMALLLNEADINVIRFNFPFMDKRALLGKKYPPDRMPKLLSCYQDVIEHVISQLNINNLPLIIGGKSMGSRAAATLIAESDTDILTRSLIKNVLGVFCLGYPFHPAKKPEKLRLEPLLAANKPILIIQGERDALGNKGEVISYQLPRHCQCIYLADGDHSLKPRVKSGFTYPAHMQTAADEIALFIDLLIQKNNRD